MSTSSAAKRSIGDGPLPMTGASLSYEERAQNLSLIHI